MVAPARIAAITGGNRGIGFAIVRNMALAYGQQSTDRPLIIYLTARDAQRGEEAVNSLLRDQVLREKKVLAASGGLVDIQYRRLDVGREDGEGGMRDFTDRVLGEHGGLDILVNNAGIVVEGADSDSVRQTLKTNYYGTLSFTQGFLPHMKPGSRIVNMASLLGKLNKYSPRITQAFRDAAASSSVSALNELMVAYQVSTDVGNYEADGWPGSSYAVSKTGVIAATMCLGRLEKEKGPGKGVLVNCCCPGFVRTDMTKGKGRKDVDAGAKTPVLLALDDAITANGEFWERERVSTW